MIVFGFSNPAVAALRWLQAMEMTIDEQSFFDIASKCGDSSPEELEDGFIVKGYEDLTRLCHIGNFVILQQDGTIRALEALDG